ncbi:MULTISPECIES: phage major capsid protein [Actinomycetes]|uniref:phage major capsid protein n=1 Tax=Actinomycetes TaxID=1760 RepID=UPI002649D659|nr:MULTISPECIES: phage major capsid protein [Actinomycetes]MDN5973404.1 phage major capsid protein [Bifidobacterium crudilactis]MDN6001593.1 phage major capsid protein [Bifidobacterium crudilactis]MDN6209994.1 phage major capsid protein [Bifidobacterium crudilactis]MDN6271473.1 phage major capsid protein [Bifidobacterium crudilactis]MDN6456805.1 phage major capsid protein [Yaniella sp.]
MNLKEKRAAALAKAQKFNERIANGEELGEEDVTALKGILTEVKDLDAQLAKAAEKKTLLDQLGSLGKKESKVDNEAKSGVIDAKTPGDFFMKSLKNAGMNVLDTKTRGFQTTEFKGATDVQHIGQAEGAFGPLVTDIDKNFVMPYQRPLLFADILGSGTVSGNSIKYPVFKPLEGSTAFVAEGGAKPQIHLADPTWVTDSLAEVAGFFNITDDMAEDADYVVSEINSTALYDLQLREELALLSGDGTSNSIKGVLKRDGIQTVANVSKGTISDPDLIFKGISAVQEVTGFAADGIVINPADYQAIRLSKDSNGQYFGGGFFAGQYGNGGIMQNPSLWGLRTVVSASIPKGTVAVGAFAIAAKVFRKGGVRIESTNSHGDNFTNDQITVRLRERLGLQVKYPAAIAKVTLGTTA